MKRKSYALESVSILELQDENFYPLARPGVKNVCHLLSIKHFLPREFLIKMGKNFYQQHFYVKIFTYYDFLKKFGPHTQIRFNKMSHEIEKKYIVNTLIPSSKKRWPYCAFHP